MNEEGGLERWCLDAVSLLEAAGLSSEYADMSRQTIERYSGSMALYEVAEGLALEINELSIEARKCAEDYLKGRYGFGYKYFSSRAMKKVRAALRRGFIRNESEYRMMLDLLSDTTLDPAVRDLILAVVAPYEALRAGPG